MPNFDIKTFNGGSNNFIDGGLIPKNQGQIVENAVITDGNLVSVNGLLIVNPLVTFSPLDLGHYGADNRSVISYLNKFYWSINDALSAPYYAGNLYGLGVDYPVAAPSVSSTTGSLTGTFKYCHTFLSDDGWESAPGINNNWSSTLVLSAQGGSIALPANPGGMSKVRTYRTIHEGNDYYLVSETTSFSTTITDTLSDLDLLVGELMNTLNHVPPPDGGKFLTEANGTFFLAVANVIYYSEQGNPHAWPPLNTVNMPGTITGLVEEFEGILAFTSNATARITGYDVLTIAKNIIPTNQGCKNWRTISTVTDAPIWESNDGLCIWDGSVIKLVSHDRYNIDFTSTHSVVSNDIYYLFHSAGALTFDRRSGDVFAELSNFIVNEYAWYDGSADKLYLYDGATSVFEYGAGVQQALTYLSPHLNGATGEADYLNNGTSEKTFRRIWLRNDSPVTVTLYVESVQVFSGVMAAGDRFVYFAAGLDGRYAEVKLETTGTIFDFIIEYEVVL